ncbi:MAG: RNA polymerase sigma factor [Oscillospiraceae bacterium]|nr:RNA polymerase sigma factor [Oscillospiraceae bacterium]MBP1592973.1 RNA polymerase sigma factor [Oscillospiraceae bacterium]MBQ5988560.1 RNA polymerase sigma factor [Oscillospiraceae bacterium]MBR3025498.1 RNA polymerase sigma factor [Oscillospiraceae bacterium]MBR3537060.1 RNA polymerase sigma factor [Oscillospiraceae bacterium]
MEDEKIIDLYWERSESAITETDKKYRSRCIYVARSVLNDISDAEECLNDTYLTAWNLMPPERPKFLSSFLFKIVRNLSLNKLRFNNNSKRKKDISFSTEELEECVDGNSSVEDKFDESEVVNAINEFLESLKKDRRYIFVRRYWYLDSIADIAGHCSMTEDNVMKILSRTRMQLKEYLKGRVG